MIVVVFHIHVSNTFTFLYASVSQELGTTNDQNCDFIELIWILDFLNIYNYYHYYYNSSIIIFQLCNITFVCVSELVCV